MKTKYNKTWLWQVAKYSLIVSSWIPVCIGISDYIGSVAFISGSSMSPTLNPDSNKLKRDLVTVNKFRARQRIKVGDIVMLRSPIDENKIIVKRVTQMDDYKNIPNDHIWIQGDNIHSIDSNNYGPVSINLVIGIVGHVVLPLYRFGLVPSSR